MTDEKPPVENDLAPDADEPGDTTAPVELEALIHEGDIVPDNVDKPDPEDQHEQFEKGEQP